MTNSCCQTDDTSRGTHVQLAFWPLTPRIYDLLWGLNLEPLWAFCAFGESESK